MRFTERNKIRTRELYLFGTGLVPVSPVLRHIIFLETKNSKNAGALTERFKRTSINRFTSTRSTFKVTIWGAGGGALVLLLPESRVGIESRDPRLVNLEQIDSLFNHDAYFLWQSEWSYRWETPLNEGLTMRFWCAKFFEAVKTPSACS